MLLVHPIGVRSATFTGWFEPAATDQDVHCQDRSIFAGIIPHAERHPRHNSWDENDQPTSTRRAKTRTSKAGAAEHRPNYLFVLLFSSTSTRDRDLHGHVQLVVFHTPHPSIQKRGSSRQHDVFPVLVICSALNLPMSSLRLSPRTASMSCSFRSSMVAYAQTMFATSRSVPSETTSQARLASPSRLLRV